MPSLVFWIHNSTAMADDDYPVIMSHISPTIPTAHLLPRTTKTMTGMDKGRSWPRDPPTHLGERAAHTSNPAGWQLILHWNQMDDFISDDLPSEPTTKPQLLPNLIQAGFMTRSQCECCEKKSGGWTRTTVACANCPAVYPTIDFNAVPPRGRLILRRPNGRCHN